MKFFALLFIDCLGPLETVVSNLHETGEKKEIHSRETNSMVVIILTPLLPSCVWCIIEHTISLPERQIGFVICYNQMETYNTYPIICRLQPE